MSNDTAEAIEQLLDALKIANLPDPGEPDSDGRVLDEDGNIIAASMPYRLGYMETCIRYALSALGAEPVTSAAPNAVFDCETCGGSGTIDETLGGEFFSNPRATCPDCDGLGEIARTRASSSHE